MSDYNKGDKVVVYEIAIIEKTIIGEAVLIRMIKEYQNTERWEAVFVGEHKIQKITLRKKNIKLTKRIHALRKRERV